MGALRDAGDGRAIAAMPTLAEGGGGCQWEGWVSRDGLTQTSVQAVEQTRDGYLWLGTQEGLNRYDGYGFRVYKHDPEDPASLSDSEVLALAGDRRDGLWIGTFGGGLNRFRWADESFSHHRHDPADERSLSDDYVTVIREEVRENEHPFWMKTEFMMLADRLRRSTDVKGFMGATKRRAEGP